MEAAENLKAVAKLIEECIDDSGLVPSFKEMVTRPLSLKGKALSGDLNCKWPQFVLLAYESAAEESALRAAPAAAAIEFLTTAFDLLDDLQDDDSESSFSASEKAQLLNVATALLFLSQRAVLKLKDQGFTDAQVLDVMSRISSLSLKAGNGQHLDILFESSPEINTDKAEEMTALKAGSLVSCAFTVGALLGTKDSTLVDLYASVGWHIGIIAQLINDLHDVFPDAQGKSDIRRNKKTVPIAYLNKIDNSTPDDIMGPQEDPQDLKAKPEADMRQQIWQEGGIHFAWVLAQTHLYEAQAALADIALRRQTDMLFKAFIEPYL